jgi:release factor glutamine methyltransferase
MAYAQDGNTIRDSLKWAIAVLKKSEIEFPEINADTLLAYVLSCDRTSLYTSPGNAIDDVDLRKYKELIHKRASHVPLQYIAQQVEFMSLNFMVDERVLIPRPETEILVETVLKKAQCNEYSDTSIIIMEIGTGSGNIAVSLAKNLSNAKVYTNDISADALTLAKTNIIRHKVVNRVHLLHGDFFNAFVNCVEKEHVNFVVSNPPYISESEWNRLEPEVREHEPRQALVGGEDGLCFYRKIISDAHHWLKPGGYLVIEIGETQADTIKNMIKNEVNYKEIEIIKDLQGKERIISARKK